MASINPFSPIQEGTGTPSPDNIRPIKPAVSIAGGKNLFEIVPYTEGVTWYRRGYPINPIIDVENDEITLTSVGYGNTQLVRLQNFKPGTYTFSFNMELSGNAENYTPQKRMIIRCYDSNRNRLSSSDVNIVGYTYNQYYLGFYGEPGTFTVPNSVDHFELTVGVGNDTEGNTYKFNNIQLEEGSESTEYEPYQSLDIYGGYLDIGNSRIVEEYIVHNGGWKLYASANGYGKYELKNIPLGDSSDMQNVSNMINTYAIVQNTPTGNRIQAVSQGSQYVRAYMSLDENYSADNVQYGYKLATPITHYLSPTQLAQAMSQLGIRISSMMERKKLILLNSPHVEIVQSGNTSDSAQIAAFRTDMRASMKSLKVYFSPIQSGSGNPSPSNIRSITGRTGLTVKKAGVNLLECDTFTNGSQRGIVYTGVRNSGNQIESITMKGTGNNENNGFRNLNYTIDKLKLFDGKFAFNAYSNQANMQPVSNVLIAAEDGTTMKNHTYAGWYIYNIDQSTYTSSHVRIQAFPWDIINVQFDTTVYPMMCLAQDQGCEFEPYKGIDIPISWQSEAGTLYGGYVDLVSGELIQTMGYSHFDEFNDWRTSTATSHSPYRYYVFSVQPNNGIYESVISDKLAPYAGWDPYPFYAVLNNGGHLVVGAPEELSTLEAFKAWLEDVGGIDVAYPLVNPIRYILTPQQIKSFIGRNNIWSDAGNVEIKYWTH